jgi:branched-chain amino acid transport system ATP-binding protein
VLKLQGVSFSYGALRVTDNVSLELAAGEAVGVIGPNGAGKSTLFDLACGTRRATQGHIHVAGTDATRMNPNERCRLGLARTFQIPRPFCGMTVFENVLVGATLGSSMSEAEADVTSIAVMEQTGLIHRANEPAGSLRLLDLKRLELARALALKPRLLLLDEIAGGLSDAECAQLVELITGLRANGVTVLWIEHVVHALLSVVDRLVVLAEGRILIEGKPREVIDTPEVRRIYLGLAA